MNCPECNSPGSIALEARGRSDGSVRRRRQCRACGHRWTTLERTFAKLPSPLKGARPWQLPPPRNRKLTDQQALAIFYSDKEKTSNKDLAKAHGVSIETVRQIRAGKIYGSVIAASGGLQLCTNCIHWASPGHYCTMGFPDPEEEGPTFASDCSLYEPRTQETSRA